MRNYYIALLFIISSTNISFSQDTIVNYVNYKGDLVSKKEAVTVELITKKDSLWLFREYYTNGKLKMEGHYKRADKKIPVGKFVSFYRNDSIASVRYYDHIGQKSGKYMSWSDHGTVSSTGYFINDKKEGVWNYYHFNGVIASRQYFKKDSLLKSLVFNENGQKIRAKIIEEKLPEFKGGQEKFKAQIRKLAKSLPSLYESVEGEVMVNFTIDYDGKITDVSVDEKIPRSLENQLIYHFKRIKGWAPAIHMNRKIRVYYHIPVYFKTD